MPELPEVETSRRGIAPWVENQQVSGVVVRDRRLRWPIPGSLDEELPGQVIQSLRRRAKYLLFETDAGTVMLHLGMSGSVRIIDTDEPAGKHDHVDIQFDSGKALRFRDPRRFGSLLWTHNPVEHLHLIYRPTKINDPTIAAIPTSSVMSFQLPDFVKKPQLILRKVRSFDTCTSA